MSVEAALQAVLFVTVAIVLGLAHIWNDNRGVKHRMAAEEALRLNEIRLENVKQLKVEHLAWSGETGRQDTQAAD